MVEKCLICNTDVNKIEYHIQKHKILKKEYFDIFLKKDDDGKCLYCRSQTKFFSLKDGYNKFCSIKCAKKYQSINHSKVQVMLEKRKRTCINKYGIDHPMKSDKGKRNFIDSMMNKYGVDHYSKTKDFKNKVKYTCINKYGVDHFNKTEGGKLKIKTGFLKKYNIDNISKLNSTQEKIKQTKFERYANENYNNFEKIKFTMLKKYGYEFGIQNREILEKIKNKKKTRFLNYIFEGNRFNGEVTPLFDKIDFISVNHFYTFKCNLCNTNFKDNFDDGLIPKCPSCYKNNNVSEMEIDWLNFLKIPTDSNNRQFIINNFKVDGIKNNKIYEFLGDFWHGNPKKFLMENKNPINKLTYGELYYNTKNKLYHLQNMGYTIYYTWELDWVNWLKNKTTTFPIKLLKNHPM